LTKQKDSDAEIIVGGNYDKGYFVEPTVIVPPIRNMLQWKLNFWSVKTIYVYEDSKWSETLKLVDETSEYALTGAF
jgi:1-pyrroline-5-carboxylate dehydrogenase